MKKIIYFILLIFAGLSMSCEKQLEVESKSALDGATIFSNELLIAGAVDGILQPLGQTDSYRGRFMPLYGTNTDMEWLNTTSIQENTDLARYVNSANNSWMDKEKINWNEAYKGIERANVCIYGIRTYGNPQPGNGFGLQLGRALTYRAFYYADLLKAHGDVVPRFEPINSETLYMPKVDRGVVYKQIIADLDEAAKLVPWPNESSETSTTENINKAFIKGLRAKLCLAAAGYSLYPDMSRRINSDPELSVENLYPIALQECKDIIESGTVRLEDDFETVFKKAALEDLTAGGESLWEIPWAAGRGRHYFTFAVPHNSADKYTGQARGGSSGPLPFVFYDYDVNDLRRDVTCVPYQWGSVPATQSEDLAIQVLNEGEGSSPSVDTWYFGKFRYEWMTRYVTSTNDDGVNKIYMRYAEVLLMAAEIENELGNLGNAKDYLKQIRRRAFADDGLADAYVDAISGKEAMFEAIVKEQGLEFCGEMERKQALIRWNLLKSKMDEAKIKMNNLRNRTGEYADVPETIYYRYAADDETLEIYGLNRGETADMSADYTYSAEYVSPDKLDNERINLLYTNNPDVNQFWPIWASIISASNGALVNDYGY